MSGLTVVLNFASFAFLLVSFIYLIKRRKNEDEKFEAAVNIFTFGLFILIIGLLINFLVDLRESFRILLLPVGYMTLLGQALILGVMPLAVICFLVAIMVCKENA